MSQVKYIGVFGRRNAGKSSLINAVVGQEVSIVSVTPGTTTDPVRKRMELPGLGPCVFIDTAGIDDEGELGRERVRKTERVLSQIDLALLLYTDNTFDRYESDLLKKIRAYSLPIIIIHSQSDIIPLERNSANEIAERFELEIIEFSSCMLSEDAQKEATDSLIKRISKLAKETEIVEAGIFAGLVSEGDVVLLVCPIDGGAPAGRLILPQVNAIRELLDKRAIPVVMQPESLSRFFEKERLPVKFVVTDSQAFSVVANMIPKDMPLTGFSMLLARSRADFGAYLKGTPAIDSLKDGDRVLILESCSHHSSCEDIGRVKLPLLLKKRTNRELQCDVVAGFDEIPAEIGEYALLIQCGGCMITKRQLLARLRPAIEAGVPVTNYGMALAYCMGIYERAIWIGER